MNDKLHSLSTNIVTPSQTTALSPKSLPLVSHYGPSTIAPDEQEEPYTIKCICGYTEDDGLTIYCDNCDTWQHIECFYPHNIQEAKAEDFEHSCADCQPRPLDRHRANERQSLRRSGGPGIHVEPERKPKRPPSKTPKKKVKPNDLHLNGTSGSDPHSKPEGVHTHQHKKSKSTHRLPHSVGPQPPKRSPSQGQKGPNPPGHPPSPATTPDGATAGFEISFSNTFTDLCNGDRDVEIVSSNSFVNLQISNKICEWPRNHAKLRDDVGCEYDDVFQKFPTKIDDLKRAPSVTKKKLISASTSVQRHVLTAPSLIEKDVPLLELNGQIGIQKDYCEDPENRWSDTSSPLPFVFFHPLLPLYIDTRKEGSHARYVRRSCKPNAVFDTYLSEGSEYHFWLVSDRRIVPNEEITIPWDFRLPKENKTLMLRLIGLCEDETYNWPEYDLGQHGAYQSLFTWLDLVLSENGGCACGLGNDCSFQRFYRDYVYRAQLQLQPASSNSRKSKSRKPKANAISPTSTGQATNSRAPSEGHGDDADNDSASSHSKPGSRDLTPARQGSFDTLGILTEPTDRDKRKVAMVEDSFRRMEQLPPRKKKRTSDGAVSSTSSKSRSRALTGSLSGPSNAANERRYVNASTNRGNSDSPTGTMSPSMAHATVKAQTSRQGSVLLPVQPGSGGPRPSYCDASVQTDPVPGQWFIPVRPSPKSKKRVVSLTQRLLQNRHRSRADEEQRQRLTTASPTSVTSAFVKMDLDSPTMEPTADMSSLAPSKDGRPPSSGVDAPCDATMSDGPLHSPTDIKSPPTPVTLTNGDLPVKVKSADLRVQMPPIPGFNGTIPVGVSATTPLSSGNNLVQSPFSATNITSPFGPPSVNGVGAHPSPVKKKLSLSDYTKSRMNKAAAAKPLGASSKPAVIAEEAKSPPATDVVMSDSPPAVEKAGEP